MGDRLRKAREHAGLGSQQMADLLFVSRNTITRYEGDSVRITVVKLRRWAEVTGVPVGWLAGDPDPATPVSPCNQRSYVGARELLLAA